MKNKLSNLKFKSLYDSLHDDVVGDFYEKALSCAKYYDRISSFFDSKILAYYAQGIEKIYNNRGKIRFIFSEELSEHDYNQIKEGYNKRVIDNLDKEFEREPLDEVDKMNLSNLAFLISKGLIDIKIAFVKNGILHDKMGLIYDNDNNYVFFRGSNNETVAAIKNNSEYFEVSCSRNAEEGENRKIENAKLRFQKMRNNEFDGAIVADVPDVVFKKIEGYNTGKLIYKGDIIPDDVIAVGLSEKGEFFVCNKLNEDIDFEGNFIFKRFLKDDIISKKDNQYFFGKMNYVEMNKMIGYSKKIAIQLEKQFFMTESLIRFIQKKTYRIREIKELGKAIKQKDSSINDAFEKFKAIVDRELKRPLRPKQMWDSFFMGRMIKGANYSVPGAGKTAIVYGAYSYLSAYDIDEVDNIFVVGPLSSFKSRKDEFEACFEEKRELRVLDLHEYSKEKKISKLKLDSKKFNLILINYESINSIKDTLVDVIDDRTFLVFDEVHKVKARNGIWASAALTISENAKYKAVLTGTPIPNSYADLYNQLQILYKDEYDSYFEFGYDDLKANDFYTQELVNDQIYPFFCRTTKKDLGVPIPNEDEMIMCDMTPEEKMLFDMIHKKFYKNKLLLYVRLLQASTNPQLVLEKIDNNMKMYLFDEDEEDETPMSSSGELNDLDENIKLNDKEKNLIKSLDMTSKFWSGIKLVKELKDQEKPVLVRGIFVNTIKRIHKELRNLGIKAEIITGEVPTSDRERIIEDFKSGKIEVLITNPHTMAESVSLHKTCHDAVYFEYSFNLTHMLQSRDRINRLGLKDTDYTQYYYLFLENESEEKNSIDKKTYDRLKLKEKVMLDAIEGQELKLIDYDMLEEILAILDEN